MLLRIDDTDPARNVRGGEEAILRDLEWLRIACGTRPGPPGERQELYRAAVERLGDDRFGRTTLLRETGRRPTSSRASWTTPSWGSRTSTAKTTTARTRTSTMAPRRSGTTPPEYVHHGLILGEDGKKLSKRAEARAVASLHASSASRPRPCGYLEELSSRATAFSP